MSQDKGGFSAQWRREGGSKATPAFNSKSAAAAVIAVASEVVQVEHFEFDRFPQSGADSKN